MSDESYPFLQNNIQCKLGSERGGGGWASPLNPTLPGKTAVIANKAWFAIYFSTNKLQYYYIQN